MAGSSRRWCNSRPRCGIWGLAWAAALASRVTNYIWDAGWVRTAQFCRDGSISRPGGCHGCSDCASIGEVQVRCVARHVLGAIAKNRRCCGAGRGGRSCSLRRGVAGAGTIGRDCVLRAGQGGRSAARRHRQGAVVAYTADYVSPSHPGSRGSSARRRAPRGARPSRCFERAGLAGRGAGRGPRDRA